MVHKSKNWLLVKNTPFFSDQDDILAAKPTQKMIIFTKFPKDRRKIAHFLLIGKFSASALFLTHPLHCPFKGRTDMHHEPSV